MVIHAIKSIPHRNEGMERLVVIKIVFQTCETTNGDWLEGLVGECEQSPNRFKCGTGNIVHRTEVRGLFLLLVAFARASGIHAQKVLKFASIVALFFPFRFI